MPTRLRVLLADDDEWVREAAQSVLDFCGHEVLIACDGPQTVEVFQAARAAGRPVDVVVLDVRMPRMTGPEVLVALRALDPEVPILLCSGYEQYQLDPALFRHPRVRYLAKPMDVAAFEEALRALCPGTRCAGASDPTHAGAPDPAGPTDPRCSDPTG